MRIHTDTLTMSDFYDAARIAGVEVIGITEHGSRSRKRAFNIGLSGSGVHGGQWGRLNYKSATWDEWGIFLAEIFRRDPRAHCGKNSYRSAMHFHWTTGGRFKQLTPGAQHIRHRWNFHGRQGSPQSYYLQTCQCGAVLKTPGVR